MANSLKCTKCGHLIDERMYLKSKSPFFPNGRVTICTDCLEGMIDSKDLLQVDRLLRWMDYPFMINEWVTLYEDNGEHTLRTYAQMYWGGAYPNLDWKTTNEQIRTALENKALRKNIDLLRLEWVHEMEVKWQGKYTVEEFEYLEYLHADLLRTQNVTTAIQKNWALVWCKKAVQINRAIREDQSTKEEIKECNDIIKAAGFEPKNAKNSNAFDSVGELIVYCVSKGWTPKFYDGKDRDLVDLTIKDVQAFLRRLVQNEPGLSEQVEQRKEAYRVSQELEQNNEQELDHYEQSTFDGEYEDEMVIEEDSDE